MPAYMSHEHFYVLDNKVLLPTDMFGRTFFVAHSERDWKILINLWNAFKILRVERPRVILSTGAGIVVPFALVGRVFFGTKVIFIETITRVSKPSLTGRIMYRLAHDFYYQWEALGRYFPKGCYGGPLI